MGLYNGRSVIPEILYIIYMYKYYVDRTLFHINQQITK